MGLKITGNLESIFGVYLLNRSNNERPFDVTNAHNTREIHKKSSGMMIYVNETGKGSW